MFDESVDKYSLCCPTSALAVASHIGNASHVMRHCMATPAVLQMANDLGCILILCHVTKAMQCFLLAGMVDQKDNDWFALACMKLANTFPDGLHFVVVMPAFQTLRQQTVDRIVKAKLANATDRGIVIPSIWASKVSCDCYRHLTPKPDPATGQGIAVTELNSQLHDLALCADMFLQRLLTLSPCVHSPQARHFGSHSNMTDIMICLGSADCISWPF